MNREYSSKESLISVDNLMSRTFQEMKNHPLEIPMISDQEFQLLSAFVHQRLGILWESHKKDLAYTRLYRRVQNLKMKNFQEYYQYLVSEEGHLEVQVMINAVTTTKTSFFREKAQFDFLEQEFFPKLRKNYPSGKKRKVRIWSAACSTGEEAYTLALLASEGLAMDRMLEWDLKILASDINTKVLSAALLGQYPLEKIEMIPQALLKKYFHSRHSPKGLLYETKENLKSLLKFRPVNLLAESYPINARFDLIFCRNILIYFDTKTQEKVLKHLLQYLHDDGYLFLGGSEVLRELKGIQRFKNNIYQKIHESIIPTAHERY